MVILGRVKCTQRKDFGDDRFVQPTRGRQLLLGGLGHSTLLVVGIENDTSILRPPVDKLTTGIRGVHVSPEHVEQLLVGDFGRVINHLHGLHVPGATGRNLLVGGIGHVAAGIPRNGLDDAVDFFEIGFGAPEAAAGKNSGLSRSGFGVHLCIHFRIGAFDLIIAEKNHHQGKKRDI